MRTHPICAARRPQPAASHRRLSVLLGTLLLAGCGGWPIQKLSGPSHTTPATPHAETAPAPVASTVTSPPATEAPPRQPPRAAAPPATAAGAAPIEAVPADAIPRVERISTTLPNLPYHVRGQDYQPSNSDVPMQESGIASWYGEPFHGRRTANGEVYDMNLMTAAHKTMPLPSYAVVRHRRTGKEIVVRVNDRGPFKDGRVIDLSRAAARKLGISGLADVDVRRLTHQEIRTGSWKQPAQRVASAE